MLLEDENLEENFECGGRSWDPSRNYKLLMITRFLYFQLFQEPSKLKMEGEDKDLWEMLNAFTMNDEENSDEGRYLLTMHHLEED